jgi:hypothetical protein
MTQLQLQGWILPNGAQAGASKHAFTEVKEPLNPRFAWQPHIKNWNWHNDREVTWTGEECASLQAAGTSDHAEQAQDMVKTGKQTLC